MRLKTLTATLIFCSFHVFGFAQVTRPQIVSIIQLMTAPEKFDGKRVVVFGFMNLQPEGNRLYLGKADYENALLPNSVVIEVSAEILKQKVDMNHKYVRAEGIFHTKALGLPSEVAGELGEVSQCKVWSDPEHPLVDQIRKSMPQ